MHKCNRNQAVCIYARAYTLFVTKIFLPLHLQRSEKKTTPELHIFELSFFLNDRRRSYECNHSLQEWMEKKFTYWKTKLMNNEHSIVIKCITTSIIQQLMHYIYMNKKEILSRRITHIIYFHIISLSQIRERSTQIHTLTKTHVKIFVVAGMLFSIFIHKIVRKQQQGESVQGKIKYRVEIERNGKKTSIHYY